jgi:hypothetical protein
MDERTRARLLAEISETAALELEDASGKTGDSRIANAPPELFLATAPPQLWDWYVAAAVVLVSLVGLALAVPYANQRWPVTPSFIAAYESALLINDLITAVMLFGQFRQLRSVGLLIVGCGYLFDALIVAVQP